MAIKGYFFNAVENDGVYDRTYNAEDFTSYLDEIVGNGVFPTPSTQLQVSAGTGMQVIVAAGQGWINGHKLINTASMTLSIAAADALLNRIDNVVFYADYTNRLMGIKVVQGTAAASPTAPALVRTAAEYQMCLATVTVNKQTTAISQSNINDTRANSNLCGWVAGLIQQVDTSTLFTQWQTAYSEFYTEMQSWLSAQQSAYESWFNTMTGDLQVGAYIRSYDKTVTIQPGQSATINLDMTGYTYEETDIIMVYINGLRGTPLTDYLINTSATPVQIDVNLSQAGDVANEIYIQVLKSYLGDPPTSGGGSSTSASATLD